MVQTTSNIKLYFRHPNPIKSKSAPQCGALSSAQLKWVKIHCAADCGRETTASWYIKLGKGINLNYLK